MDLWPKAKAMYRPLITDDSGKFIGLANIQEDKKIITFPSGARTKFAYLELDKHSDSHYGAEYTRIYFDEFQKISEYNFDVIRSRNRSMAAVAKGIRCTLNPDPTHFVYNWVKPFLDEEGYPVKEICGKTRYYVIYRGILYTDWSSENLKTQFGKNPQTYTYIPSLLTDNEEVLRANPDYADILDSMPERKRKQLLLGCWKQDDDSGVMFDRKWLLGNNGERAVKAEDIPIGSLCYRGIDKAYSTPHETHRYPDFTAISPKIYKTPDGRYILAGDYHEDIIDVRSPWDNEDPVIGRVRKLPGSRDDLIVKQAHMDGRDVTYVLSKDNGGGAADYLTTVGRLIEIGTRVKADQTPKNTPGKKVKDFEDFSAASEAGLVYIAIDTFNPKTLEAILAELESFNGEKSNHRKKDDWCDAIAMAFNALKSQSVSRFSPRNQLKNKSIISERMSRLDPFK